MDLKKLYEILNETTIQLRKGEVIHGTPELVDAIKSAETPEDFGKLPGGVMSFDMMPHADEAKPDLEKIDLHFLTIGVDKQKAEQRRAELVEILKTYPNPDELAGGPSYIAVGAAIGDQGAAFQLFALGQALNLWDVITPKKLGLEGALADQAAGVGYIMCTGYRAAD